MKRDTWTTFTVNASQTSYSKMVRDNSLPTSSFRSFRIKSLLTYLTLLNLRTGSWVSSQFWMNIIPASQITLLLKECHTCLHQFQGIQAIKESIHTWEGTSTPIDRFLSTLALKPIYKHSSKLTASWAVGKVVKSVLDFMKRNISMTLYQHHRFQCLT